MAGRKADDGPSGRRFAPGKALEGAGQGTGILVAEPIGDLGQREPRCCNWRARPSTTCSRHWRKLHPSCWRKSRLRVRTEAPQSAASAVSVRWMAGLAHPVQHPQQARVQLPGEGNARRERVGALQLLAKHRQIGPFTSSSASSGRRAKRPASSGLACKGPKAVRADVGT